jgi:integrase
VNIGISGVDLSELFVNVGENMKGRTGDDVKGLWMSASGVFYFSMMVEGRRVRKSLETKSRDVALGLVGQMREGLARGQMSMRWEGAVDAYLRERMEAGRLSKGYGGSRRTVLMAFGKKCGVSDAREVSPAMVRRFVDDTRARTGNATTGNHYLRHLRMFFEWCVERGLVLVDPGRDVSPVVTRQRLRESWVPVETVRVILDRVAGDEDLSLVFLLGFEAGFRRSEILGACPEWVDMCRGLIRIPATGEGWNRKNNREAVVPLSPRLRGWFAEHPPRAPFLVRPDHLPGQWRYRWEFRKQFAAVMRSVGLDHVTIHDMRRSFASNRVSAGVPIERVASWMGIDVATAWRNYARFLPVTDEIAKGGA